MKQSFLETFDDINKLQYEDDDNHVPDFKVVSAFLDMCGKISSEGKKLKAETLGTSSVVQTSTAPKVRLPALDLPQFNGEDLCQWEVFYHTFNSMIHENKDLSNEQKVQYLVSKLTGKAQAVCVGIPCIGNNYQQIYDALVDRYMDKRVLASYYLDQITSFKKLNGESVA